MPPPKSPAALAALSRRILLAIGAAGVLLLGFVLVAIAGAGDTTDAEGRADRSIPGLRDDGDDARALPVAAAVTRPRPRPAVSAVSAVGGPAPAAGAPGVAPPVVAEKVREAVRRKVRQAPATPRQGPVDRGFTTRAELLALRSQMFVPGSRTIARQDWVARFLPLYRTAAETFGVPWMLLASIHQQETGFSTHPTTYRGLNFAKCCGGPMQFNVTNGPVSTWTLYRNSFRAAKRPAGYPNRTRRHPSLYDDFDAIMAAGALLRDNGATRALDGSAWRAAYLYYGRDLYGVTYANTVLARAQGWAARGRVCSSCGVDAALVARAERAFGAAERAVLESAAEREAREKRKEAREKRQRAKARAKARRKRAAARRRAAAARRERAAERREADAESARRAAARKQATAKTKPKAEPERRPAPKPARPPAQTTPAQTTPAQTTPAQTTPAPAQTTPAEQPAPPSLLNP